MYYFCYMKTEIVITGLGIVSSIGMDKETVLQSLLKEKSGVSPLSILHTVHKKEFVLGEIKYTHDELKALAGVDENHEAWTRTALLGYLAARQAFQEAGFRPEQKNIALVSASTVGGMDRTELYYNEFEKNKIHLSYIETHHCGNHTEMIAQKLKIKGYLTTLSTACSSSLNSLMHAARLIRHGIVDKAIAGGADALAQFTLNGFHSLMILDKEPCRPFDERRNGLNLGEGAAYLVLEKEADALREGKTIYAYLKGFGNANDAHHQTATSDNGEGPYLAMKKALDQAGVAPEAVGYINAHGTGTPNNDLTEGRALLRLFGDKLPPFSSTKGYTGHTLGASGAMESVFSILALNRQTAFPNINFTEPIKGLGIKPVTTVTLLPELEYVLTNSFGFGGNDSSILFFKPRNKTEQ